MKSDVITIDNQGNGYGDVIEQAKKVAAYKGLGEKDSLQLQMLAEELLSLSGSVTGELGASFWIEGEGKQADLHLTTKTVMDKEKRYHLISTATSRKNEAAKTFLGKLRDAFEEAMTSEVDREAYELPADVASDIPSGSIDLPEWDGYERSIIRRLADTIKIGIRGKTVDMTVSKKFN